MFRVVAHGERRWEASSCRGVGVLEDLDNAGLFCCLVGDEIEIEIVWFVGVG